MHTPRRRRQPALVRAALLDAAVQEAMMHGLGNVTVLSVAERAGVSKGALFHHFANRQELLEAAYAECLARFGDALDVLVAADQAPHGRFTRAYVRATFEAMHAEDANWARFSLSALVEPAFAALWRHWLDERLAQVPDERGAPRLRVARLAADGYWLQALGGGLVESGPAGIDALRECVVSFTYDDGQSVAADR